MLLTDQDYTGRCACPGGHTTKTTGKSLRSDCMITPATKICDNTGKCFQIPSGATNIKSPITGGIWNP
jgi:hypothetical protein